MFFFLGRVVGLGWVWRVAFLGYPHILLFLQSVSVIASLMFTIMFWPTLPLSGGSGC